MTVADNRSRCTCGHDIFTATGIIMDRVVVHVADDGNDNYEIVDVEVFDANVEDITGPFVCGLCGKAYATMPKRPDLDTPWDPLVPDPMLQYRHHSELNIFDRR